MSDCSDPIRRVPTQPRQDLHSVPLYSQISCPRKVQCPKIRLHADYSRLLHLIFHVRTLEKVFSKKRSPSQRKTNWHPQVQIQIVHLGKIILSQPLNRTATSPHALANTSSTQNQGFNKRKQNYASTSLSQYRIVPYTMNRTWIQLTREFQLYHTPRLNYTNPQRKLSLSLTIVCTCAYASHSPRTPLVPPRSN